MFVLAGVLNNNNWDGLTFVNLWFMASTERYQRILVVLSVGRVIMKLAAFESE